MDDLSPLTVNEYAVEYHDSIDSTNRRARELASTGARDILVLADRQTGGRGRLDREWSSPSGGLWCSLLFRPDRPVARMPLLTLAAAVATTRAVRTVGVDAGIKWPNDLLVDGRKLAGILTESGGERRREPWVVVGIGVNANVARTALPEGATSLREVRASNGEQRSVDRNRLIRRLIEEFDAVRTSDDEILDAWREHAVTLGQHVRVETPNGTVVGDAVDVESPGALVVRTDEGRTRIHAGDCEHLRPVE